MDTFLFHKNCTSQNRGMAGNREAVGFVNSAVRYTYHIHLSPFRPYFAITLLLMGLCHKLSAKKRTKITFCCTDKISLIVLHLS